MVEEFKFGLMGANTKATGKITKRMDKADLYTGMVTFMREIGLMIRLKALESTRI